MRNIFLSSWNLISYYLFSVNVSCVCVTGNSVEFETEADTAFEVRIEADNDTEHPHDDKPRPYVCTVCEKRFRRKSHLKEHRNRTIVTCVARHLVCLDIYKDTWESTLETNLTSVDCVTKVSAIPAPCSYTNVVYTSTEDHISVLTVECWLNPTFIWSVMFVFTLVQSRTPVDTVHTVFHGLTNSRHICWSHTMKVLGRHVTFARRSSAMVVTLRHMYVDICLLYTSPSPRD